jgi:hypothetical protein
MVTQRIFDQQTKHDPRSLDYPVRELFKPVPVTSKFWSPGAVLDQGQEGACVGHGIAADLSASPVRVRGVDHPYAQSIYMDARKIDGIPDSSGEGTSVNAGMKIAVERGFYTSYHWAFSLDDVIQSLLQVGPVVIGINWYAGMYEAPDGVVSVSGECVGGHCILLTGYAKRYGRLGEVFRWRNSWGPGYGRNGNAYIKADDLGRLLIDEKGEAAIPVGRKLVALVGA